MFDFVPDNQGIIDILARQIEGPYRFAHHALNIYVQVGPAFPEVPITVHEGPGLRLRGGKTRTLRGLEDRLILVVYLVGVDGVTLAEVGLRPHPSRLPPMPQLAVPSRPEQRPPRPQAARPAWFAVPEAEPLPSTLTWLRAVYTRYELDPPMGDYVVIPATSVSPDDVLPRWVVRSDQVDAVHVVQPRLGPDADTLVKPMTVQELAASAPQENFCLTEREGIK